MSELPRLDDFGREIKYSRWDGTQRLDALEADELLGAMSDELLAGGDLEDALARLSRWGMPGRMEGMKDLLERLRSAKQKRAERHDLSKVFDELREKLEEVKRLEREGLERRRDAEAPNEQLRQGMQKIAQERLAQLDALLRDITDGLELDLAGRRSDDGGQIADARNDGGLARAQRTLQRARDQVLVVRDGHADRHA